MLEAVEDIAILVSDTVMPGLGGRELAAFAPAAAGAADPADHRLRHRPGPAGTPDMPTLRKPFDRAALAAALAALNPPADPESPPHEHPDKDSPLIFIVEDEPTSPA
jgi:hypothetical protein